MKKIRLALIMLSGGTGKRVNKKLSKQMISYNNVSILEMNIINFRKIIKNICIQIVSNEQDFLNLWNKHFLKIRTKSSFFAPFSGYELLIENFSILRQIDLQSRSDCGEWYSHQMMDHIGWKFYIRKEELLNFSKLFSISYLDIIWRNKGKKRCFGISSILWVIYCRDMFFYEKNISGHNPKNE